MGRPGQAQERCCAATDPGRGRRRGRLTKWSIHDCYCFDLHQSKVETSRGALAHHGTEVAIELAALAARYTTGILASLNASLAHQLDLAPRSRVA
jgi:hypothetical protein